MKWVRERDLLIAQTLAFVQSVSGKKPAAEASPDVKVLPETKSGIDRQSEKAIQKAAAAQPVRDKRILELPGMSALPSSELRQEIQNRVALFRTHQERLHREREAFFAATMAQLRTPRKDSIGPST